MSMVDAVLRFISCLGLSINQSIS